MLVRWLPIMANRQVWSNAAVTVAAARAAFTVTGAATGGLAMIAADEEQTMGVTPTIAGTHPLIVVAAPPLPSTLHKVGRLCTRRCVCGVGCRIQRLI